MHYVVNFKISHGRPKYSCRCLINLTRSCVTWFMVHQKKHAVFFLVFLSSRSHHGNCNFLSIFVFEVWNDFLLLCQRGEFHRPEQNLNNCCVLACVEYVTDRDFPNHYVDRVNAGLSDMRDNTFSFSKEQLKEGSYLRVFTVFEIIGAWKYPPSLAVTWVCLSLIPKRYI